MKENEPLTTPLKNFTEVLQRIDSTDQDIIQDNSDLRELEKRYESLDIPYSSKRIVDDYIACIRSKYERLGVLLFREGVNSAKI